MIVPYQRFTQLVFLSAILLQLPGCKSSDSAKRPPEAVNYSQYTTFNFGKPHILSSENPVFSWPQFRDRVEREIIFTLPGKGLDLSRGNPDLLVYYYAIVDSRTDPPLFPYRVGWAAAPFIRSGETFSRYGTNTLVVDMVDAHSGQLVWRGSIDIPFDNPEILYKELPKKVYTLLNRYPTLPAD